MTEHEEELARERGRFLGIGFLLGMAVVIAPLVVMTLIIIAKP